MGSSLSAKKQQSDVAQHQVCSIGCIANDVEQRNLFLLKICYQSGNKEVVSECGVSISFKNWHFNGQRKQQPVAFLW